MADLSVKEVRQRVQTAVESISGVSVSRFSGELFTADPRLLVHKVCAVDAPSSEVHPEEGRQRLVRGALLNTDIRVQAAHRLRGDAMVADTDDALDFEATLIETVLAISRTDLHIVLVGMERDVTDAAEFRTLTITFRAIHRLALQ